MSLLFCYSGRKLPEIRKTLILSNHKEIDFWIARAAKVDSIRKVRRGLSADVSNEEYIEWWEEYLRKK